MSYQHREGMHTFAEMVELVDHHDQAVRKPAGHKYEKGNEEDLGGLDRRFEFTFSLLFLEARHSQLGLKYEDEDTSVKDEDDDTRCYDAGQWKE